jgi:hypothetical protein
MNFKEIPIISVSHNRLNCMIDQVASLEQKGYRNIHIADCGSTYAPLLEYLKAYDGTKFKVHYLPTGESGPLVFERTHLGAMFTGSYNVLTDNDVIPTKDCPDNFMEHFYNIMQEYSPDKVGFGLKLDDLPEHYPLKAQVLVHESTFWKDPIRPDVYRATIDTTFALNRPNFHGAYSTNSIRTGGFYQAHHYGWYMDYNNLPADELYYHSLRPPAASWINYWNQVKQNHPPKQV